MMYQFKNDNIMSNEYFILKMYLGFWWLTCILYKDNILPNAICELGERTKGKVGELLQELSRCYFCMDNWIATFLFAIPISIINQEFQYLIYGFFFAAISTHFRK